MLSCIIIIIVSLVLFLMLLLLSKKTNINIDNIIKIITVIYIILSVVSIILPDGFIQQIYNGDISYKKEIKKIIIFLKLFNNFIPVIVITSVFFKNKSIKNILVYIVLPLTLLITLFFNSYIDYFTMPKGRGLNTFFLVQDEFKSFLINKTFRSIHFGMMQVITILICLKTYFIDKNRLNKENKTEIINFILITTGLIVELLPIYIPQYIIGGTTNIIFGSYSVVHFLWILSIVIKIILLYTIFKTKSYEDKYLLCVILSLVLFYQYNSMFSLTINIKRLPIQPCNIASYLILLSFLTRNKHIFNATLLINVSGAFLAVLVPDVNQTGILEIWNLHFVYEHTNIIVIPLLGILFNIFPKVSKETYVDARKYFLVYFSFVLIVGITLNYIANTLNNHNFDVNYLFMFDRKVATDLLKFLIPIAKPTIHLGKLDIYPGLMMFVFFGYNLVIYIFYNVFKLFNIKVKNNKQLEN